MEIIKQLKYIDKTFYKTLIKCFCGSIFMAVFSQIYIPLPFVPITLQTLALTILALSFGSKDATLSIILYIFEGLIGIPVFAEWSSGVQVLFGTSGGFIWGFLPTAYFIGYFADKNCLKNFWKTIFVVLGGTCITFAFGLLQLSMFVPIDKLLEYGLIPFIPGGIVKGLMAIFLTPKFYKISKEKF